MLILITILIACIIIAITAIFRRSSNSPPGPYPWPVLGNLRLLRKLCREFGGQHQAFLELTKKYRSNVINLRLGNSDVTVVCGFEDIRKILRDEVFDGRPWSEFIKIRNMGMKKGITMAHGPEWREMRAWLMRSLKNLGFGRVEMSYKITEELKLILDKLQSVNHESVELKRIIGSAVINVIWSLVTGKRIDEESRIEYFLGVMERRAKAFDAAGGILSMFPWLRHIAPKASGYELLVTLNKEMTQLLMKTIDEHRENYVKGRETDLIDMFFTEMYHGKGPEAGFTEDQLLMILADIFIAGLQTTAVTLDFMFLYMATHQDIQSKLQDELDTVIRDNRLPQATDRALLPYTEAVITESQRLRLVVPIIGPRRTLDDTTLSGYTIPKNSFILMNIYSIHLDPENFEDPHTFKPERFIKDGVYTPDKKLIFFGGGHRRCPGEAVAKSAIFMLFAGIMKCYKIVPVPGLHLSDQNYQSGLTISPKPYKVRLIRRKT